MIEIVMYEEWPGGDYYRVGAFVAASIPAPGDVVVAWVDEGGVEDTAAFEVQRRDYVLGRPKPPAIPLADPVAALRSAYLYVTRVGSYKGEAVVRR